MYPDKLVITFLDDMGFHSMMESLLITNGILIVFFFLPSTLVVLTIKGPMVKPTNINMFMILMLLTLFPFNWLGLFLVFHYRLKTHQKLSSLTVGFLQNALDTRNIVSRMLSHGSKYHHKGKVLKGELQVDANTKKQVDIIKAEKPIKLDYSYMISVLVERRNVSIMETAESIDEHLYGEETFKKKSASARRRLREEKKAHKAEAKLMANSMAAQTIKAPKEMDHKNESLKAERMKIKSDRAENKAKMKQLKLEEKAANAQRKAEGI